MPTLVVCPASLLSCTINSDVQTLRLAFSEGEYSALEHESVKGVVECLKVVTQEKSKRIAKFAFDYATRNGRKKVKRLVVHG